MCPRLAPRSVRLADPLLGTFDTIAPLNAITSVETPSVTLPTRQPAVSARRRVAARLPASRQRSDVSDSQLVPSHPEPPTDILPV